MWLQAGPHPSSVIQDPPSRWRGGCCHGGPCAANSSRVKWEIFIPRVRERAGRRPRAGELGCLGTERPLTEVCRGRWGWACPVVCLIALPPVSRGSLLPLQG